MTGKQNKLSAPTKPAPVELQDKALDRATGGAGTHVLYQDIIIPLTAAGSTRSGGANFALADGSVR